MHFIAPALLFFCTDRFRDSRYFRHGSRRGFVELGNITVGGLVSGINSLVILDFANAARRPSTPA